MNRWLRWLAQVLGLVAVATALLGCGGPITDGIRASNVTAITLRETHDVMAQQYEAAQERAAKGADTIPAKLDAVEEVSEAWGQPWAVYEGVRGTWVALVATLQVAIEREKAGLPFDASAIIDLLVRLQASQAELAVILDRFGITPEGAPPRGVASKGGAR